MEEFKNKISSNESQINEKDISTLLPGVNIRINKEQADLEAGGKLPTARISNALSESIIINTHRLEDTYNLSIDDKIVREATDEEGKLIKLSFQQKKILLALQAQLSTLIEKPSIKNYIEKINRGENPQTFVKEFINLKELCKHIYGEEEKGRDDYQKTIKAELKALSEVRQLQIYKVKALDQEGNEVPNARIEHYSPYLSLTGEETRIHVGEKTAIAVEVIFSRIFLERINNRYINILPSFWEAKTSKGKKIKSDHFISLSTLAFNLAWTHYRINLPEVEKYVKKEKIIDTEKIQALKEQALTHTPIPFDTLKDAIAGKIDHPQKEARFKEYLWEAMRALINYGLITKKSRIDWEKETITLVYNADYNTPRMKQPSLVGTTWEEYVAPKSRKKK